MAEPACLQQNQTHEPKARREEPKHQISLSSLPLLLVAPRLMTHDGAVTSCHMSKDTSGMFHVLATSARKVQMRTCFIAASQMLCLPHSCPPRKNIRMIFGSASSVSKSKSCTMCGCVRLCIHMLLQSKHTLPLTRRR